MPHTAYIGLGANLGDPLAQCRQALRLLETEALTVAAISSFYRSPPLVAAGKSDADIPWYINAVAEIKTDLNPRELLSVLLQIETQMGRTRREKWESRVIDLDLLLYDDLILNEPDLVLPHPEIINRPFVLIPLRQIAPTLVHPVLLKTVAALCQNVKSLEIV